MLSVNEALSYDKDAIGIGRKGTIDKPYILKAPFWTVDTLFYAIPRDSECLNFSNYIFQNINWRKKDESTGVPSLSKNAINNTLVEIPNRQEQLRIGKYLGTLDHLSTLHQRQLDEQKALKKYFLQNMFPAKGEKVPRIRLQGFTGDWEQRKLYELADVKDSARIPNSFWSEEGVPYIRASDLTSDDLTGTLFLSNDVFEHYKSQTGVPEKGDVLFNGGGEIGKAVLKVDDSSIYVQGGAVLYVKTSKSTKLRGDYLKAFFQSPSAKKYIEVVQAGGTMKHFTLGPAQQMPVIYPSQEEQRQIGSFFTTLDITIALHQRQLTQLQAVKKFMLQNLFI
ncbi:MAG: hypothetical protein ACFWT1_04130 [Selenomonas sp.]